MFTKLYKLYSGSIRNTPTEDFTTELLVGVLNAHEDLRTRFCKELLGMHGEDFQVSTQVYYPSPDLGRMDCFVDMVIENEQEVCFVENKVNSPEGVYQLERYAGVLNGFIRDKRVHLKYCTKRFEQKDSIMTKYEHSHNFSQFHWHHIGALLKDFQKRPIVKYFIEYLEKQGLHMDMKLKAIDMMTMENIARILSWSEKIIENEKPHFQKLFGNIESRSRHKISEQLEDENRKCGYTLRVILPHNQHSEILYSIMMEGSALVQIYLSEKHASFQDFTNLAEDFKHEGVCFERLGSGARLVAKKNLALLINDEAVESKLHQWYCYQYKWVLKFIEQTNSQGKLKWDSRLT